MCCCGYGSMVDPGAYIIADLKKGDEITLKPGCGEPESDDERTLIVLKTAGYSALCTDGTLLMCSDGCGVTKTGRILKANASLKAILILLRITLNQITNWFRSAYQEIDVKIWFMKQRMKYRLK